MHHADKGGAPDIGVGMAAFGMPIFEEVKHRFPR